MFTVGSTRDSVYPQEKWWKKEILSELSGSVMEHFEI